MKEFIKVGDFLYRESTIESIFFEDEKLTMVTKSFSGYEGSIYHIYSDKDEYNRDKQILMKTLRKE